MNISIVLCTYNGQRYLPEQLASIRSQTRPPFEIVVCDDGSGDQTSAIVEQFAKTVAYPVHFHRNPVNLGSTKNFEQGIRLCRGDAIALCDQDDRWHPDKLLRMASVLDQQPHVAGVFSDARLIDDHGSVLPQTLWQRNSFSPRRQRRFHRDAPHQLIRRDTVTGATLLFRAGYREALLPISPEWVHDGWIALLLATLSELQPLPACLMDYRLHAQQQIGASVVPWHSHLATRKQAALESHQHLARRLEAMLARLEQLAGEHRAGSDLAGEARKDLRRKIAFLHRRARMLGTPRIYRIPLAIRSLPDYFEYQNGVLSLLRDLLH